MGVWGMCCTETRLDCLLDWPRRFAIAVGAAQGLAYLHHDCVAAILHRDVKSNSILLEYACTVRVTEKSDVYSFGVVFPELLTGRRPNDVWLGEKKNIVQWVTDIALSSHQEHESGSATRNIDITCLDRVLDPRMDTSSVNYNEAKKLLNVALSCTAELPMSRPSMRRVVELLKEHSTTRSRLNVAS